MTNRLAQETSPYLLQHAENPVNWYPWSAEALEKSRDEGKPIFLSIGYSACHWCHVMEHESFEDPGIAKQLNEDFVCIKVDREERPDLDQIYMQAVQLLTGRGGWPMSVFLTPELKPFFGGTYWPPKARQGMPGFNDVLTAVLDAWRNRRTQALEQAEALTERIAAGVPTASDVPIDVSLLQQATQRIVSQFDHTHGGFGQAPKFPHAMTVQFLLRMWKRDHERNADLLDVSRRNLDHMAAGGIYDHLAGGFARYSVDERWLVPHFEKMLYDNALLLGAYLDAFTVTGEPTYGRVASEICNYQLTYMTDDAGGFHSTEDADSEGVEGKFYVWTAEEIRDVLGEDVAERFCYVHDVSEAGNFEGKNILNIPKTLKQCARIKGWDVAELSEQMLAARSRLLEVRDRRTRPGKDDKVLTNWNGLMIHSMARAGVILGEDRFLLAAIRAAEFVLETMHDGDHLLHTYRHGQAKLPAYLDDYANLANCLATLYESTFEQRWLDAAVELAETILGHFADTAEGGFYYTADDHESLIARTKDLQDSSIPSGNAMAATALIRLGRLCNRNDFLEAAGATLAGASEIMRDYPLAVGQMLIAADLYLGPIKQLVVAEESNVFVSQLRKRYLPRCVLSAPDSRHMRNVVETSAASVLPRLYVCEGFSCQQPVVGTDEVDAAIGRL
jgi:uncharacterized protein YyaL (SSP411 family)